MASAGERPTASALEVLAPGASRRRSAGSNTRSLQPEETKRRSALKRQPPFAHNMASDGPLAVRNGKDGHPVPLVVDEECVDKHGKLVEELVGLRQLGPLVRHTPVVQLRGLRRG